MDKRLIQLPECPLEYQVAHIPGSHTALVIEINTADIHWQEKMLPWTLASLVNNTDIVMKGVHLYIVCEDENIRDRIRITLNRKIDLPPGTLIIKDNGTNKPLFVLGKEGYRYDNYCLFDINYWAFRGISKRGAADIKLPFGHVLRYTYGWAVADYNLHPENNIRQKDTWVRMSRHLSLTDDNSPNQWKPELANYLVKASERAEWLHDANRAVYGENYGERNKNVAAYFFNEGDPNWHLDASILQYTSDEANDAVFIDWANEWEHLGTEALIALWLLKTGQHAYNLGNSVIIEPCYIRAEYPRLCNMKFADIESFTYATRGLRGAQLNIAM